MKINKNQLIYIVDDDVALNKLICKFLEKKGFNHVKGFHSGEEMLSELNPKAPPLIIQDFDLPGMNGLSVIKEVKNKYPKVDFIFLSGQSSIEVAVEAIKLGAYDYIIKDSFAKENALTKINNLLKMKALVFERNGFKYGFYTFLILFGLIWSLLYIFYIRG